MPRVPVCADTGMKCLSSFGFVPQSSQGSIKKRAKPSETFWRDQQQPPEPSPSELQQLLQPPHPSEPQQLLQQPQPSEPQQLLQPPQQFLQLPQPSEPLQKFVRNDLGIYSSDRLRRLSDEDRLWLLHNAFRPDAYHKHPQKEEYGKKRSFQHAWLVQFPWLCYSQSCNGGFCINCVLFAKRHLSLGQLVTTPIWTRNSQ